MLNLPNAGVGDFCKLYPELSGDLQDLLRRAEQAGYKDAIAVLIDRLHILQVGRIFAPQRMAFIIEALTSR